MPSKLNIKEMQSIAKTRGGKCLSNKYINTKTKLKWKCKNKHIWDARPGDIKRGRWCRKCATKRNADKLKSNINEMKSLARAKKGQCLSGIYTNTHTKLKWKCKNGHVWDALPLHIKQGVWCPYCAGVARLSIEEMQNIARARGGKCLSRKYVNSHNKLKWKCKNGHVWAAMPIDIKHGSWCPDCSIGISERLCRKYFELIFHKHFPTTKLKWLLNSKGNIMELDGYNKETGVAFEYQGEQHYKNNWRIHNRGGLKQRIKDDRLKNKLCRQHGIILIKLPYTVSYDNMCRYIYNACKRKNIKSRISLPKASVNLSSVYSPEMLKEMQALAQVKGGQCLSDKYINTNTKLKWKCNRGHVWQAVPLSIKAGSWCPFCAGTAKLSIEEMQKIAKSRGGKCLSNKYTSNRAKLKWKCKEGHIWRALPVNVKAGHWCSKCAIKNRASYKKPARGKK